MSKQKIKTAKAKAAKVRWTSVSFEMQSLDDMLQLDTENDQIGTVIVEHVIRRIRVRFRDVFGRPPSDIEIIDWKADYGIAFRRRPSPYDFPAFEHERINVNDSLVGPSGLVQLSDAFGKNQREYEDLTKLDRVLSKSRRDKM